LTLEYQRKTYKLGSEKTKEKNNQLIEEYRQENKELKRVKEEIIANKKAAYTAGAGKKEGGTFFSNKDDNYWKSEYDRCREKTKARKKELLALKDKLNEVSDVKNAAFEESPLTRQIRILENKLDKIMIKYNEAQSIRKTYEQIVKRLKEERIGYDNQLAAIERSLKGKEHDYVELLLLSHDAKHAKELALSELKKYKHKKEAVRKLREKYIEEKRKQLMNKHELIDKQEKQNKPHDENSTVERDRGMSVDHQYETFEKIQQEQMTIKNQTLDFKEGFRKLYEVTGTTNVNDIISKYTTQDETSDSLANLKKAYNDRITKLKNERNMLKEQLANLKYEKEDTQTRKQIDEIEKTVNDNAVKCERYKLKYQRIHKILVSGRAGVEHISNLLAGYTLDENDRINEEITEENMTEALKIGIKKMKMIFNFVKEHDLFRDKIQQYI